MMEKIYDFLIVKENFKVGLIDSNGKKIIPCCYEKIVGKRRDRFIVCQKEENGDLLWGVINDKNEIIINIEFQLITVDHSGDAFFQCFTYYSPESEQSWGRGDPRTIEEVKSGEVWFNIDGLKLHEGVAKVLSDDFIAVCANDCWGIMTRFGDRVTNFQYDDIDIIKDKLIVAKDKKVGVLDTRGSVVINPSYNCIENVFVQDHVPYISCAFSPGRGQYGKYSKDCIFDTDNEKSNFFYRRITVSDRSNYYHKCIFLSIIGTQSDYCFDNLFILTGEGYCELFSVKEGIIPQSRYDEIRILTNNSFAVRKKGKWGVLCAVSKGQLVIPCDFDRIIFEGGSVALLCKNGLWGAQSFLINVFRGSVNVPNEFLEIRVLDKRQSLFGVKVKRSGYNNSIIEEYTIVDKAGKVYGDLHMFSHLDRQCEIFDLNFDRILASKKGKYGFISSKGYISIPFQFDNVERREDKYFDVRINNAWGVLDISGKEIVEIKYSNKIPLKYANTIVQNASTCRYGILSEDGSEKIPSIYEHLMLEDAFIFYGYNGYEANSKGGSFFSNIECATWGVMDNTGRVLIDPKYDCYKISNGFLLAGRDGGMLYHDDSCYGSDYSGVYDLYTLTGELLFGGFREFFYNKENELYIFFFGGDWVYYNELVDEWNNISIHKYTFKRGIGQWLFLDKNLKSIIRNSNGNQIVFDKGTICKIEIKEQEKNKTYVYNIPISIMAKGFSEIKGNNIIIGDSNNEELRKLSALNIVNGEQTPFYQKIEFISGSTFFFSDENKIGIRNYNEIIVDAEFLFMTYPVNGFYFTAKELDKDFSRLALRSINDSNFYIEAINKIKTSNLIDYATCGHLIIKCEDKNANVESIILSNRDIFDESFVCKVSKKESTSFCSNINDIYWFATDCRMKVEDYSEDHDDYESTDYARDTWDAMTDGMYGDMPDGFDGDYGFMGR